MAMVKCGVDGCNRRLQPYLKVDPRDRDTWLYQECSRCGRPACDEHVAEVEDKLVCTRCLREARPVELLDLGLGDDR